MPDHGDPSWELYIRKNHRKRDPKGSRNLLYMLFIDKTLEK